MLLMGKKVFIFAHGYPNTYNPPSLKQLWDEYVNWCFEEPSELLDSEKELDPSLQMFLKNQLIHKVKMIDTSIGGILEDEGLRVDNTLSIPGSIATQNIFIDDGYRLTIYPYGNGRNDTRNGLDDTVWTNIMNDYVSERYYDDVSGVTQQTYKYTGGKWKPSIKAGSALGGSVLGGSLLGAIYGGADNDYLYAIIIVSLIFFIFYLVIQIINNQDNEIQQLEQSIQPKPQSQPIVLMNPYTYQVATRPWLNIPSMRYPRWHGLRRYYRGSHHG